MKEEYDVQALETSSGRCPYFEWERRLPRSTRARVLEVIGRLRRGNFGAVKSLRGKLFEIRLHVGPGYRIYFGREGGRVVLLLCAGDKSSQKRDIERARKLWKNYLDASRQS